MRISPNRAMADRHMAVMVAAVIFASGCTMVRGAPTASPDGTATVEPFEQANPEALRAYGGSVTFDGNRISLVLELVGADTEYSARLSIPSLDLDAGGEGRVDGERLVVELSYAGTCPGQLRLNGRFQDGMRRIEGSLTASDCTGEEEGAVVLLLRPGG